MTELIREIITHPISSLLIAGNLVIVESILSVDNAAVLATMAMKLPAHERRKALKYGLFGAYLFRGICLLLASYLVAIWWLKGLGGVYLLYLSWDWWWKKLHRQNETHGISGDGGWLYRTFAARLGTFWATVVSIELMDLAFSIDNVFAAVAFSPNIIIILSGVFIGILAMRFVAQAFVALMERYPFLEACAYTIIGLLGIKLSFSFYEHYSPESTVTRLMESHAADWITSGVTLGIIFVPIIIARLFGKRRK
jgi:YkoY family integral membrane protein